MTTIALVGHRGFVGRSISGAAEQRGHAVRAVDLDRVETDSLQSAAAVDMWIAAHDDSYRRLVEQLRGADAVVNAAGSASPDSEDRADLWSSNVLLPMLVARAATEAGVDRFVHLSSAAVQGDRAVLDETAAVDPQSPYAESKAEAERLLRSDETTTPATTVIYRPTSVMGPGRPTTQRLVRLFGRVVPTGGPHTALPLALVDNVADAAVFLATIAEGPPSIVTHPDEGMTAGRLADLLDGRTVRVPAPLSSSVVGLARRLEGRRPGIAGVRRRAQLLLEGQRIEARTLAELGWHPPIGPEGYQDLAKPDPAHPIRLAYLITRSDTIAGAQVHVRDLSEAMTQAGHDVRVFIGGNGPLADQLRDRGVDVHPIMSLERDLGPGDARALVDIRRALKEFGPDLLSCHSSKSGILGRIAGRSLGIPTIFTAHGWSFADGIPDRQRRVFLQLERAMAPLAAKLITVAHADRELALREGVGRPDQHITIHNAVHDVRPGQIADPSIEPPTIVSIARLDDQKDHPLLIRALAELDPTPRIQLVGDGPKEQELRTLAADLGIADRVDFLGLRHDVPDLLSDAQIYVLVSNWEGLPRSIIEALRAGLPVVATDVGGVRELVDDDNGHVLPHGDLVALVKALVDLSGDRGRRGRLGRRSRARYENHFTFGRVLAETKALYGDLLGVAV